MCPSRIEIKAEVLSNEGRDVEVFAVPDGWLGVFKPSAIGRDAGGLALAPVGTHHAAGFDDVGLAAGFKQHDDDRQPAGECLFVVDGRKIERKPAKGSANAVGDLADFAEEQVVAGQDSAERGIDGT